MIDLEGLEKLIAEATDTPWRKGIEDGAIYATEIDDDRGWSVVVAEKVSEANAALIVAAVNALPGMIARVEALEAELEAARVHAWLDDELQEKAPSDERN